MPLLLVALVWIKAKELTARSLVWYVCLSGSYLCLPCRCIWLCALLDGKRIRNDGGMPSAHLVAGRRGGVTLSYPTIFPADFFLNGIKGV